jgi:PIN domain nuclease of toxin-antitoxin system
VRLLVDTSVLIFAAREPGRLTKQALAVLADPENIPEISTVSISEIAIKTATGKLQFSRADVQDALDDLFIRILPYAAVHAFHLFDLPLHHTDPFDRQIIAQALYEEIPIITSDEKFSLYKGLEIIW